MTVNIDWEWADWRRCDLCGDWFDCERNICCADRKDQNLPALACSHEITIPTCPKCEANNLMRIAQAQTVQVWKNNTWELITIEYFHEIRFMCQTCLHHFDDFKIAN